MRTLARAARESSAAEGALNEGRHLPHREHNNY